MTRVFASMFFIAFGSLIAARGRAQFNVCPQITNGIPTVIIRNHHSISRSSNFQTVPWNADVIYAYERSWEGWAYLDLTNHMIWLDGTTANEPFGWSDANEIIERRPLAAFGQARSWYWPTDQLDHVDFRIDGPDTSGGRMTTTHTAWTTSCVMSDAAPGGFAETGTIAHEIGHGYGYAHFDAFPSMMNTSNYDFLSCEGGTNPTAFRSMYVQPDPQSTQCHDNVYGIYDGIDLAVNAITMPPGPTGANIGNTFARGPGPLAATVVTTATPPTATDIEFSILNNRDAIPSAAGAVRVGIWLGVTGHIPIASPDIMVDSFDITGGFVEGEVRRRLRTVTFDPSPTTMPIATVAYCLYVRVDELNTLAETRESNNVTDTRYCWRRTS